MPLTMKMIWTSRDLNNYKYIQNEDNYDYREFDNKFKRR